MGKLALAKRGVSRRNAASRKRKAKANETGASAFRDLVTFFKSPVGERLIVLEIFIFTVMTLLVFILYRKELRKREELQVAMDMIRTVVVGTDPIYEDKDDLEILAAAQNISEEMQYFANLNDQLQKEIDTLLENLNNGWVIYERTFYWFSIEIGSWTDAQKHCEQEGARLISVETREEQYFINKQVERHQKFFWIGVFKDKGKKWSWLSGMEASVHYWNYYEPNYEANHDCVAVSYECYYEKCWMAFECDLQIHYICKKVPNDTWL
ncbi:C-type lectin domain family 4 member M-like isoform X1 [Podarcis raffonei]|uniref:C-type lectin domain family 4 member M-like isoform X1 n=1 Tax=Podarcis raffonei TaxID=65483 RepID=UPI0023293BAA|nr:C-type lectin domain family 4 member M-like isoform X1 [Podarcis raffonei]XP_053240977.1 C-type lectin domain family 4 member M-like isoform X1 [Podarcis raffonei]XP_053240978.1 C-type lectin domain family 4 member M-like isoform X1 [Podarcis raffonei]